MNSEKKRIKFTKVDSLKNIADLRTQYLDSLPEAQEYYLELLMKNSRTFLISANGHRIGYFIIGDHANLLEYFLLPEVQTRADTILEQIIHKFALKSALCKTFDPLLLSCCVQYQKQVSVGGFLFREYHPVPNPPVFLDITHRLATIQDFPKLCAINVEIFEEDDEIREYIEKQRIFLFEKSQDLVGFGIFTRIIADRPEHDIGMLVDKPFQRQGYGQFIIRFLTDFCMENGWQPVCGCAYENTASRRTLEKAGYISKHRLLNFSF